MDFLTAHRQLRDDNITELELTEQSAAAAERYQEQLNAFLDRVAELQRKPVVAHRKYEEQQATQTRVAQRSM